MVDRRSRPEPGAVRLFPKIGAVRRFVLILPCEKAEKQQDSLSSAEHARYLEPMARFQLKDLRDLTVAVAHPQDADGEALVEHLRRIGCRVEPQWPPPKDLSPTTDIVIASIDREWHGAVRTMLRRAPDPKPGVISVVDYENPATLQLVLETESLAVLGKPIRPFGLLANLAICRSNWLERQAQNARIGKLESKLSGQNRIAKAKSILIETQGISEKEAYASIRAQAMAKRVSMEAIASAIINANELLRFRANDD